MLSCKQKMIECLNINENNFHLVENLYFKLLFYYT